MKTERINWIENLRAIAVVSVVFGHISNPTQTFIFTWHMPLFFMISGFFLNISKTERDYFASTFKRLIPLFFVAMSFGFLAEYSKNVILNRDQISLISKIWNAAIMMDYGALKNSYGFVLWFLPALFWARCSLFLIFKFLNNNYIRILVVILLTALSTYFDLPFGMDEGFFALPFVCLGFYVYHNIITLSKMRLMIVLTSVFTLYVSLLITTGLPNVDLAQKVINPYYIGLTQSIMTCVLIILIFYLVPVKSSIISIISRLSVPIFVLHPYTNNVAHVIVEKYLSGYSVVKLLLSIICILGMCEVWKLLGKNLK